MHRQQFLPSAQASPAMQQPVLKGTSKPQAHTCPLALALARLKESERLPSGQSFLASWGCNKQMRGSALSSAAFEHLDHPLGHVRVIQEWRKAAQS